MGMPPGVEHGFGEHFANLQSHGIALDHHEIAGLDTGRLIDKDICEPPSDAVGIGSVHACLSGLF